MTTTGYIKRYLLTGMVVMTIAILGAAPVAARNLVPASDGVHMQRYSLPVGAHASNLVPAPNGTVLGYSLPGVSSAGWPNFENNVTVRVIEQGRHGTMLIARGGTGKRNFFNLSPDTSYLIRGGSYLLRAYFDPSDNLLDGSVRITGSIDTEYGRASGVLMTADLGDPTGLDGIDWNYSSDLIGFDTYDIQCNSVIDSFAPCTTAESVYLSLDAGGFNGLANYTSTGLAVTTVPVPAAAWLFGSGLLGLAGAARRKFN